MPTEFRPVNTRKRRAAKYVKQRSGVVATPEGFSVGGGVTRESILKAAEVFAAQARKNAARFSRRIPAATYVDSFSEDTAQVVTDGTAAPNAAPFEFGERHPLFGDRKNWYKQRTRAYMSRAATNSATIDQAADVYADAELLMLEDEYGYTE